MYYPELNYTYVNSYYIYFYTLMIPNSISKNKLKQKNTGKLKLLN